MGTPRIIIGKLPEGGDRYGLRVSRPGYDVTTVPVDDEQLVFNSEWPAILPIHVTGLVNLAAAQTTTINYPALDFTPHVSALVKRPTFDWQNYQMTNTLVPRTYIAANTVIEKTSPDEFVYEGSGRTNLQFRVFSDRCTLYSNIALQVVYVIYHTRAFS